jgi:hypothetical protein
MCTEDEGEDEELNDPVELCVELVYATDLLLAIVQETIVGGSLDTALIDRSCP